MKTRLEEIYQALAEKYDELQAKYEDRGRAMMKSGDTVRSLYASSEVSKRILNLKGSLAQAEMEIERLKDVAGQMECNWMDERDQLREARAKLSEALAKLEKLVSK